MAPGFPGPCRLYISVDSRSDRPERVYGGNVDDISGIRKPRVGARHKVYHPAHRHIEREEHERGPEIDASGHPAGFLVFSPYGDTSPEQSEPEVVCGERYEPDRTVYHAGNPTKERVDDINSDPAPEPFRVGDEQSNKRDPCGAPRESRNKAPRSQLRELSRNRSAILSHLSSAPVISPARVTISNAYFALPFARSFWYIG